MDPLARIPPERTKQTLAVAFYTFLVASVGEGETRSVRLVAICNHTPMPLKLGGGSSVEIHHNNSLLLASLLMSVRKFVTLFSSIPLGVRKGCR